VRGLHAAVCSPVSTTSLFANVDADVAYFNALTPSVGGLPTESTLRSLRSLVLRRAQRILGDE
jgi:hypothetical protein